MLKKVLILVLFMLSFPAMAADEDEPVPVPVKKVPSYISLGKPMVLNLTTKKKRLRFLQVSVDILVASDDAKDIVTAHIPALRHEVIVLLSEQDAMDMKSPAKRNDIRKIITEQVRELLAELAGNDEVEDVLFSSFLIQ